MEKNKPLIWVVGNSQKLIIPLEQAVVTPTGEITPEPFYPTENSQIVVTLRSRYSTYRLTPTVDGNLLRITTDADLAIGCYSLEVTVQNPDGTQLHSLWENQVVVTRQNDGVLQEWVDFNQQELKARAALFFFAKGDPGTTDYNDLKNRPDLTVYMERVSQQEFQEIFN